MFFTFKSIMVFLQYVLTKYNYCKWINIASPENTKVYKSLKITTKDQIKTVPVDLKGYFMSE